MNIQNLEAEVKDLVEERTPELLVMLLDVFTKRGALSFCKRHHYYLKSYRQAQINLTRAKRLWNRLESLGGFCLTEEDALFNFAPYADKEFKAAEKAYFDALTVRDAEHELYHSEPCACWVKRK